MTQTIKNKQHESIINFITLVKNLGGIENDSPINLICGKGGCYRFYLLLKHVYPTAEPYWNNIHILTKIGEKYYDILGERTPSDRYKLLLEENEKQTLLWKIDMELLVNKYWGMHIDTREPQPERYKL